MSKDKYRPSIADFEVTKTKVRREEGDDSRYGSTPTGGEGGGRIDGETDPRFGDPGIGDVRVPIEWDNIEDEVIEDDWYPTNLRVVKQEIRYNDQGRMRVDVTFEWDELSEASSYLLRIAEA